MLDEKSIDEAAREIHSLGKSIRASTILSVLKEQETNITIMIVSLFLNKMKYSKIRTEIGVVWTLPGLQKVRKENSITPGRVLIAIQILELQKKPLRVLTILEELKETENRKNIMLVGKILKELGYNKVRTMLYNEWIKEGINIDE